MLRSPEAHEGGHLAACSEALKIFAEFQNQPDRRQFAYTGQRCGDCKGLGVALLSGQLRQRRFKDLLLFPKVLKVVKKFVKRQAKRRTEAGNKALEVQILILLLQISGLT